MPPAILFTRQFPQFGDQADALIFGIVPVNEPISPVLYCWAMVRSGEATAAAEAPLEEVPPGQAPEIV